MGKEMDYYVSAAKKYSLGDYYGAIDDITKCLNINPNFESAYSLRGNCRMNISDFSGALHDFMIENENVKKHYPNSHCYATGLYMCGLAKTKMGDMYGALIDFQSALNHNPDIEIQRRCNVMINENVGQTNTTKNRNISEQKCDACNGEGKIKNVGLNLYYLFGSQYRRCKKCGGKGVI